MQLKKISLIFFIGALIGLCFSLFIENRALRLLTKDQSETRHLSLKPPLQTSSFVDERSVPPTFRDLDRESPPSDARILPRALVERLLTTDFQATLAAASSAPHFVEGRLQGFVLSKIRPGSIYERIGLQNGDVIEAVNGAPLNDAARAIELLNRLRHKKHFVLNVQRGEIGHQIVVYVQ